MSRKKKTDAADAQVETLVGTEQPAGGAGDGQAAGAAGKPTAAADADAIDAAAPADGGDDAGGADGGATGAETPGADDEGGAAEEGDGSAIEDEMFGTFKPGDRIYLVGRRVAEGTVEDIQPNRMAKVRWDHDQDRVTSQPFETIAHDPGPPTILCVKKVWREATDRVRIDFAPQGDGPTELHINIKNWPGLLNATDKQIADCTIEASAFVWPELDGARFELNMSNVLLEDARLLDDEDEADPAPLDGARFELNMSNVLLEDARLLDDEDEADPAPKDGPMDLDILAACAAAAVVFGTRRSNDHTLPTADYGYLAENPPIRAVAECAAAFVRGNSEVSAAVIPIHLGLKGLRPQEPVTHREYAAWTVFAATLKALDTMRATEAAEAEAQARARQASERRHSAPRDRLALMPQEGALTPSGFTPSR